MRKSWLNLAFGIALPITLVLFGCSDLSGPMSQPYDASLQSTTSVVSQDLAQLSVAGVTDDAMKGVFSIGWKKFVGPNVGEAGNIGEAFAVVYSEVDETSVRPVGIDVGTVTLTYDGGSNQLTKRTTRDGRVLYETFSKGMRHSQTVPANIPFVANGTYNFEVSGSSAFSAGAFPITAPASLLSISGHVSGETVSKSEDLNIQWTGGTASNDVLLRIVPHLRPVQVAGREMPGMPDGNGGPGGHGGPKPHRKGHFALGGPLEGMGPEFERGIVVTVPNTGSYTVSAADLQTLLTGTEAAELMIGVTQVAKQEIAHDGGTVTVLLRNGDRIVLQVN